MAKKTNSDSATISFDLPVELKTALENLATSSKKDVAAILVKLAEKATKSTAPQITFRCTIEQKESLEILAAASLSDVSSIMVSLADEFIKANAERISFFKAQAATPLVMPSFKPETPTKKSARATKKKPAAQMDAVEMDAVEVKVGDDNAENS